MSLTNNQTNSASKIPSESSSKPVLNQPNGKGNSISVKTLSSCKTYQISSHKRFGKLSQQTEMLNKPAIKKTSRNVNISIQSSQNLKNLSSQGSTFPNSNKKLPTKNRFDNLTKLESVHSNPNDLKKGSCTKENKKNSFIKNKKYDKLRCSSTQLSGIDMFDVSFDFDDESGGKNLRQSENIAKSFNKKESQDSNSSSSKHPVLASKQKHKVSHNYINFSSDDADLSPHISKIKNNLTSSGHNIPIEPNNSQSSQTPLTKPLSELKLPTKYECHTNSIEKHSNRESKVQQNERSEKSDEVSLSPEIPLKKLKDLVHINSPKLSDFSSLSLTVPVRQSSAKVSKLSVYTTFGLSMSMPINTAGVYPILIARNITIAI